MFEILLGGGKSKPLWVGGFIGEVSASEFITGDALASAIGLSAGVSQHSTAGWLKFEDSVDGKTKYIAKRPLRHSVSWNQIQAKGAVFGTVQVIVNGDAYKVRLLSGANSNPAVAATNNTYDHAGTHGCEWNRLMYRVSGKPFRIPSNKLTSEGISVGDWASYSEKDLVTEETGNPGSLSWCQETGVPNTYRVMRGYAGVSYLSQYTSSHVDVARGWRPVLELVD